MSQFRSKTRLNLQRSVKILRKRSGELELQRFESPAEVPAFLELAAPVARRSWQVRCTNDRVDTTPFWQRKLTDLAERGLLRSYVLKAGSQVCAYAFCYQGRGTLHHIQTGYDPSFAAFSPGAVLHCFLYEDLFLHRPPRRASFGFGANQFKRLFGNVQFEEATVFLVTRRLTSRLKVYSYGAFKSVVRVAKRWTGRGPSSGTAT
jgi:CelD/BcsL family acetyltransferase involved in cellulose biosynthesis